MLDKQVRGIYVSLIRSSIFFSPFQNHSFTEWYFEGWPIHCVICYQFKFVVNSSSVFPNALGEGLSCEITILSEFLRCLPDISSFMCPGQKRGKRNSIAWSDPTRNAGLSGACMCEWVIKAQHVCQHIRTQKWVSENLGLLNDSVFVSVAL